MNNSSAHHIVASSIPSNAVSLVQSDFKHCKDINKSLTVTGSSLFRSRDPLPGFIDDENNTRMVLNPDINKLSSIVEEINKNNGWCPSKLSSTSKDALRSDTRCPCPDFMIYGKCECGLFVKTSLVPDKDKLPTKQYSDFINWNKE